jgi:glycosyltransferase involved in cell wall biosynthesis
MTAIFVTHATAMNARPGGLQVCTREYLETLRAAGLDVAVHIIEHDARLKTRALRRLLPMPYPDQWRPSAVDEIVGAVERARAQFVCLNLVNLAPLAAALGPRLRRGTQVVLLSHGLESVDFLHTIPAASQSRRLQRALGRRLIAERRQRLTIDHVFCLAPFEADIERWLGARAVTALPRTIPAREPLAWTPDPTRLGFVGTLDHPPTADGLEQFLTAFELLAPASLRVRIVGGPEPAGRDLAARFRAAEYLGPLTDADLEREAGTWSTFVHPLFCWARGCSTKLAVALAWQLPIVTTAAGARGYTWRAGALPMGETPENFARLAVDLARPGAAQHARAQVAAIVASSPTIADVGRIIAGALGLASAWTVRT